MSQHETRAKELRSFARLHRALIILIAAKVLAGIGFMAVAMASAPRPPDSALAWLMLAAIVLAEVCAWVTALMMAHTMGWMNITIAALVGLLILCAFAPAIGAVLGVVGLLAFNSAVTRRLRENGVEVGLLGAKVSEPETPPRIVIGNRLV